MIDISRLYGASYSVAGKEAAKQPQGTGAFRRSMQEELLEINRRSAYSVSGRTKLTDEEISELANKYDFRHMTQETYDAFLDDLVDKGVLSREETGWFGYGGVVIMDAIDGKVYTVNPVQPEFPAYDRNTPFLAGGRTGSGDMVAWIAQMMKRVDYAGANGPEAEKRALQRNEMYGALNDVISRGAGAGDRGGSIIDQVANPDSDFYSDMFARLRIQLEQSEEEKKKQAIIDALDSILKGMQSKDGKDRKDMATSMAGLSKQISELDKEDPRRAQLDLFRQRLNRMGVYVDMDEGIFGGKDKDSETLTEYLIGEETQELNPSIFDPI